MKLSWLLNIDRRIIYLLVIVALGIPLFIDYSLAPAPMKTANSFYKAIEKIAPRGKIVLVAADWGPGTQAENEPQTAVAIEHLLRRRIPFALISNIPFAKPYLEQLPETVADRLEAETGEQWDYGQDWVNLGYRPGGSIMIQGMAKAKDLHEVLKTDAEGTAISELPLMHNVRTIEDVAMLVEVTGSVGVFNSWIQFFRNDKYVPAMVHGCTAITIPEAYIYYVSKQIVGLFEGVAGAAWYEELLSENYPKREKGSALQMMTALSFAHLLIIALIVLGNIGNLAAFMKNRRKQP
ncbi:MAG: hypothetical protein IT292_08670 [Deltaproteobacteria bacterium]|nr:hypothetical protein [Deltaproteobacteria bacterium]